MGNWTPGTGLQLAHDLGTCILLLIFCGHCYMCRRLCPIHKKNQRSQLCRENEFEITQCHQDHFSVRNIYWAWDLDYRCLLMVHTQIRSKATTICACMSQNHMEYDQAHFGLLHFFGRNLLWVWDQGYCHLLTLWEITDTSSQFRYIISPFCLFVIRRLVLDDMSKLVYRRMRCLFITWPPAFGNHVLIL